jgi:hypothetical protein
VQPLNKVTIREAGMPPAVDEFSEDFAGYPITSAIDYYSGYFQISLDKESRDYTAFLTDIGLVRNTRLPQGWTNSVATFQRVICKVHYQQIPQNARPFLDDVGLKGPKERYNDEEIYPGVRRFVYEHAQIFRQFMHDVWRSGMTISGAKSAIGMAGINIVGMICDANGRRPEERKVRKILNWSSPKSTKDARAFIGVCVYYRIFIISFSIIAAPIFELFRKGKRFLWTHECQLAMDKLKKLLTTAPILITLDFGPSAGMIYLNVDASTRIGWGGTMEQVQKDGKRKPARYESGVWNDVERKYDAVKLECRGLLKALKKFRFWLYGRYFTVETDAQTLVWLLNQPPNDLPNAMMTRWLSYIRLFDFDVKHIKDEKNGAADGLSRRGLADADSDEDDDPDASFDAKMNAISVERAEYCIARVWLHEAEYVGEDLMLGRYLETLQRPQDIDDRQYQRIRKLARMFFVRDGYIFKRGKHRGQPPRRVIGTPEQRRKVLQELHDEIGHRGRDTTFSHVNRRYQWKGMYEDVAKFVKSCEECQKRSRNRQEEPLHPTWTKTVWDKIGVDVVKLPMSPAGHKYAVFARDDLSGWSEGRALMEANSKSVSKFLFEDVICRHGCPRRVVMDGGGENKKVTKALLKHYRIKQIDI